MSAVAEWQRLTSEWDKASAKYEHLVKSLEEDGVAADRKLALITEVTAARDKLVELKSVIDHLIKHKKSTREVNPNEFVIANVEIAGAAIAKAEPEGDSPPTQDKSLNWKG